jgi:hypothetical protein
VRVLPTRIDVHERERKKKANSLYPGREKGLTNKAKKKIIELGLEKYSLEIIKGADESANQMFQMAQYRLTDVLGSIRWVAKDMERLKHETGKGKEFNIKEWKDLVGRGNLPNKRGVEGVMRDWMELVREAKDRWEDMMRRCLDS